MAGAGYKLFNTGDVLTAAQVNEYLMQQTVMVFASAAARTTALSGVLAEGMLSYLQDTNKVYVYDGSAWLDVSSEIPSQTGNSGKYLTTDGTNASWATISAGGMTLISETTASALSSLSLSSIPGTYKQLLLVWTGIYHSVTSTAFGIRLNNDATSKYDNKFWSAENLTVGFNQVNGDDICYTGSTTMYPFGWSITSTTNALLQANGFLLIDNYASTSKYKNIQFNFAMGKGTGYGGNGTCVYTSTSAITSIDVYRATGTGTFSNASNTSIRLYGVA